MKHLILVVLFAALARGQISFIPILSRSGINVTCVYSQYSQYSSTYLSILITKTDDAGNTYTASKSSQRSLNDFPGAYVPYSYSNNVISLVWSDKSDVDGLYTCQAYYMGDKNRPESVSKQINLKIAELDPALTASPSRVIEGLTASLTMGCSSVDYGMHGLSQLLLLEIFQINEANNKRIGYAKVGDSGITESGAENDWDFVSSTIQLNQGASLVVSMNFPTAEQSGSYKCILSGFRNDTNETSKVERTTQVTSSVATKQEIYERAGEEDRQAYYFFVCTFENGLCGFKLPSNSSSNYYSNSSFEHVEARLIGQTGDHTLENGQGHILHIKNSGSRYWTSPILKSKVFPAMTRRFCVRLWYYVTSSYSSPSLNVIVRGINGTINSSSRSAGTYSWSVMELPFSATSEPFTLDFQWTNSYYYYSYYSSYSEGFILIDDILVTDYGCNY